MIPNRILQVITSISNTDELIVLSKTNRDTLKSIKSLNKLIKVVKPGSDKAQES